MHCATDGSLAGTTESRATSLLFTIAAESPFELCQFSALRNLVQCATKHFNMLEMDSFLACSRLLHSHSVAFLARSKSRSQHRSSGVPASRRLNFNLCLPWSMLLLGVFSPLACALAEVLDFLCVLLGGSSSSAALRRSGSEPSTTKLRPYQPITYLLSTYRS